MNVSIIGTGYVGLVSGACLAERGHHVLCVDIDKAKVDCINQARSPFHEKGLDELLQRNVGKRLTATTDLTGAVVQSELTLIAAPTPFSGEAIDLRYVKQIAAQIGEALRHKSDHHTVVVKSTVVPGTTDTLVLPVLEERSGRRGGETLGVGMNPEFLSEGEAVWDFMNPDRIVLGGIDDATRSAIDRLYDGLIAPRLATNCKTAEMIKYASNALLATLISFSNELGNLCSATGGVDIVDALHGVHLCKELSPKLPDGTRVRAPIASFLGAGCGFGGSCLPKDVKALVAFGRANTADMRLLESVLAVNAGQPARMLALLRDAVGDPAGKRVAVLGLAFKPGTDDMRESPAIPIIRQLIEQGAVVSAFDPAAGAAARQIFTGEVVRIVDSMEQAIEDADAILLVTRWEQFNALPQWLAARADAPPVIDGRRMLSRDAVANYHAIGLGLESAGQEEMSGPELVSTGREKPR